jgi:hypothetical protein
MYKQKRRVRAYGVLFGSLLFDSQIILAVRKGTSEYAQRGSSSVQQMKTTNIIKQMRLY